MRYKSLIMIVLLSVALIPLGAAPKKDKKVKYDFEMTDQTVLDEAVMKLLPKGSQLVHQVTTGVYGPADGSMGENINIIYQVGNKTPEIMVLVPVESGKYKKIKAEKLSFGKSITGYIHAVFFAQADKDPERELFVLCEAIPKGSKESVYVTAVFDWKKNGFKRMPGIESKIKGIFPSINVKRALPEILGNE